MILEKIPIVNKISEAYMIEDAKIKKWKFQARLNVVLFIIFLHLI